MYQLCAHLWAFFVTSHCTVWGSSSSSSYPSIPQLTLLLSLQSFLVLIVSSREKERDHRGSVSSLAYSSLFCPQTGGHNTHTGFFIGLSHTYSWVLALCPCEWNSLIMLPLTGRITQSTLTFSKVYYFPSNYYKQPMNHAPSFLPLWGREMQVYMKHYHRKTCQTRGKNKLQNLCVSEWFRRPAAGRTRQDCRYLLWPVVVEVFSWRSELNSEQFPDC